MAKGLSAFNEGDGNVTVGGKDLTKEAVMNEINEKEETPKEETEFDHRSDEEKEAEGYKEIIDTYREKYGNKDEQESTDGEETTADDSKPDDDSSKSEDEPKTEPEPQKKETDDELPVIPQVLRSKALNLGITESELGKMNVEDLTKAIDILDVQPKEVEEKKEEPEDDPLDKIKLDPDEYEEDIVNAVEALKSNLKELKEENKSLKTDLGARQEAQAREAQLSYIRSFDEEVSKLENKDLFGEGDATTLKGETFDNRSKLFDAVDAIGANYVQQGKNVPPLAELVKLAGTSLFGDSFNLKEENDKQVKEKLEERSQNFLGKPSQREPAPESKKDDSKEGRFKEAASAVGEYLKGIGIK